MAELAMTSGKSSSCQPLQSLLPLNIIIIIIIIQNPNVEQLMVASSSEVGLITYPATVNIATLVIFFLNLVISIWLIIRQGLGHSSPWIWIALLSICRLTQVSLDLAATTMFPKGETANTSLESGVAILTTMGLTPLFMATSSLLNATTRPKGRRMQWILLMLHIPLIISFILIVAGGIDPDSRDGPTFAATEPTKAGVSLYLACFLVLIWSTTVISARLYLADRDEVRILTTVVLSLPFFLVDVVYMMCFAFERWRIDPGTDGWKGMRFNVISGSVTLQLCMYVLPRDANPTCRVMFHASSANVSIGKLSWNGLLLDCTLPLV
jgi:hypothetical protein